MPDLHCRGHQHTPKVSYKARYSTEQGVQLAFAPGLSNYFASKDTKKACFFSRFFTDSSGDILDLDLEAFIKRA